MGVATSRGPGRTARCRPRPGRLGADQTLAAGHMGAGACAGRVTALHIEQDQQVEEQELMADKQNRRRSGSRTADRDEKPDNRRRFRSPITIATTTTAQQLLLKPAVWSILSVHIHGREHLKTHPRARLVTPLRVEEARWPTTM